jgi:hypothetical protein
MKRHEYDSWLEFLGAAAAAQLARRPYVPISLLAHAALLALIYYFGSYQLQAREQESEVASSLRATSMANTARRVQDLETIKQLLEKSANREPQSAEPGPAPLEPPETPEEMVERARELSQAIEALDQEIRAEELAGLSGENEPPPGGDVPSTKDTEPDLGTTPVTAELAAREVAALEIKARDTLARRQRHLEAKVNGVRIEADHTASRKEGAGDSAVRAEIADFIGTGERSGQPTWLQSGVGSAADIQGSGNLLVPPVDANGLVRGRGRMVGPGGEYANRIYVNSWYIIGPFPGLSRGRLRGNPAYPPEKAVLLDAVYFGKGERLLKWRYVSSQTYPLVPPDATEDSVYYGYTEVSVDEDCDLVAWMGADDDAQIYVNDRLVWPGGNVSLMRYLYAIWAPAATHLRDYNLTEGRRVVHFNQGRNKVFFKLSNGAQGTHLSFVLTR